MNKLTLLTTILAMSITTLFTACLEIKPEEDKKDTPKVEEVGKDIPKPTVKEGEEAAKKTKPDAVTDIVPNRTKDWFAVTATPPDNRGTKADGKPVGADEIKYTFYYAYGGSLDTLMDITSITVDDIQGKAEKDGIESRLAGKVPIQGNTALKEGFKITALNNTPVPPVGLGSILICLAQPHYYFIRAEHPEDPELFADSRIMSMMRNMDKRPDYCSPDEDES